MKKENGSTVLSYVLILFILIFKTGLLQKREKKNYSKQKFNPNLNSEVVISEREKEVLTLVCMEYTAQEIAQKMEISARTVEAIKDRLMERFGVKNSVGLVFYSMKNSLID